MERILDKGQYVIYGDKVFNTLTEELPTYLDIGLINNMKLLNIEHIGKLKIYLYSNWEEYQKVFTVPYPKGTISGVFSSESVKIYADINKVKKEKLYAVVLHELTHILYKNYIQDKERIIWLDEGIAINLSGEKSFLQDDDNMQKFINEKLTSEGKEIPDIAYLHKHGSNYGEFVDTITNKYNGYDWSYLMVRYLMNTLSNEEFNTLIRDENKVKALEETIIQDTYNYYTNKLTKRRKL